MHPSNKLSRWLLGKYIVERVTFVDMSLQMKKKLNEERITWGCGTFCVYSESAVISIDHAHASR